MEQLTFNLARGQEVEDTFKNYDWLTGHSDNLKEFFTKESAKDDLSLELRSDAIRRLNLLKEETK